LRPHVGADRNLDLIGGTAGFALAAAALHHASPSDSLRAALREAADSLLTRAERTSDGLCWRTHLSASRPLCGMSHGASGMALALLSVGRILHDDRLVDAALGAMRYERATFDGDRLNWPDFRVFDGRAAGDEPTVMWAWCHGAPGIGLARLAALGARQDHEVARDLAVALDSTARFGLGSNDSLCHGDLGNLDLLISARTRGLTGEWERALDAHSARLVARLREGRWYCGIPGGVETPGLMTGLAGIGYGLLRLACPDQVPSVLSLEPPRSSLPRRSDS
jgi:lantibiotic modifying enzyme